MRTDVWRLLTSLVWSPLFVACGGGMPFQGMTVQEVYNLGVQAMLEENWDAAFDALDMVVIQAGFEHAAEARLRLAQVEYARENYLESRAEYQRVLDRFPADSTAPHASLGICRSLAELSPITDRDQSFTRQARTQCRQVASDYAGTVVGLRASEIAADMYDKLAEQDYNTGLHYLKRNLVDSAILYFEEVEDTYSDSSWVPWAVLRKVEAFERIGYMRDADEERAKLLRLYPDSEPARLLDNGGR